MPHLFADISAHGFGHLAQAAPVLNRLSNLVPDLRLTVRSGLPGEKLRSRIAVPFEHLPDASDFGFIMIDALHIDHAATAAAYRAAHVDFADRVAAEATLQRNLGIDAVFSDVAYLPLAGAREAGLPAAALCSLNWAELFEYFYGQEDWARPILTEIRAAYVSAPFLRTTPGMSMPGLQHIVDIGAIAAPAKNRRVELQNRLGTATGDNLVLIGLGGIPAHLPVEDWPETAGTHWLVPAAWQVRRANVFAQEDCGMDYPDLLASVDAVLTKPGYGTFAEAVRNGTAVLYLRREDWPEQDSLIAWLHRHARCREVTPEEVATGHLTAALVDCLDDSVPPASTIGVCTADFSGTETAAQFLASLLTRT